ncbi:transporter [Brevundimonas sp.]|uniref:transporter n=1 Tax=Brevundimonas sp. TaxID=1871086 RepID=UPI003D6D6A00
MLSASSLAIVFVCASEGMARAQDEDPAARLARLEALVMEQSRRLNEQEALLARQAELLEAQSRRIDERWRVDPHFTESAALAQGPAGPVALSGTTVLGDAGLEAWRAGQNPDVRSPIQAPPPPTLNERRLQLAAVPEEVAVLSPAGRATIDLSTEYTRSSANRLVFRGVEIVPGLQIGVIEASEADRDTFGATIAGRYGVTDRIEVDARIPYLKRNDTITTVQQRDEAVTRTINLKGDGLGDVEAGVRYQINGGEKGRPVFVAGLRVKSDTGEGPFEIPRDEFGVATRLATGSGFWGIEPSLSMLYPSDPAVIFANLSYFAHLPKDIDKTEGDIQIGRVDPGDSIGLGIGFAFALNQRFSYSLGYKHNYIRPTTTELNDITEKSDDLQVGALTFGMSYRITDRFSLNGNFEFGVTEDAPDMRFVLRVPVVF